MVIDFCKEECIYTLNVCLFSLKCVVSPRHASFTLPLLRFIWASTLVLHYHYKVSVECRHGSFILPFINFSWLLSRLFYTTIVKKLSKSIFAQKMKTLYLIGKKMFNMSFHLNRIYRVGKEVFPFWNKRD